MFVPLAEEHGLIDELTLWGLRTILRQWLDWREDGLDICIAFNISALSLEHLDFPDLVERMCRGLDVPRSRDSRLIVQAVTELAHGLGLFATAEGVETIDQLRTVRELGCDLVQGYLVSAPIEGKALKPWLHKFRRAWPAMIAEEKLALWADVETDPLSEWQI